MTGAAHSSELVSSLREVARGDGGKIVLVGGQSRRKGRTPPYWVGTRLPPVDTLFEAVLRCLLTGRYELILAFTGNSIYHLPAWKLNDSFRLGTSALIWEVRGKAREEPACPAATKSRAILGDDLSYLRQYEAASASRLLWRSDERTYWDRLREYIERREGVIRSFGERRCALIVDFEFFMPTAFEAGSVRELDGVDARSIEEISMSFPCSLEGTGADLVVFAETGLAGGLVNPEENILLDALSAMERAETWANVKDRLSRALPRLSLTDAQRGQAASVIKAERSETPFVSTLLDVPPLPRTFGEDRLYDQLRRAVLSTKSSTPTPPRDPSRVAIEFWAEVDLEPLRRALDEEIIGQDEAKRAVLGALTTQKNNCRMLLSNEGGGSNAHRTARDPTFRVPVIGLFGAAGMGKSTFCRILATSLFGDNRFAAIEDLSGKSLETETIGVTTPYSGSENESSLLRYYRATAGLGVFCFDEFTRIFRGHDQSLAEGLRALLPILEDRAFTPANPRFRPLGDTRVCYLANTVFVLSGNVSAPGDPPARSFTPLSDLGDPLIQRISLRIYFKPIQRSELPAALRRSLSSKALSVARDFFPSAVCMVEAGVDIDDAVIELLSKRFWDHTGQEGSASFRALRDIMNSLDLSTAVESCYRSGASRLKLGREIVKEQGVR